MIDNWLQIAHTALVVIGLFAFSVSGALRAVQKQMDLVGLGFLAVITATGGGVLRDVLIGQIPPAALRDGWMIGVALLGAVAVFFLHRRMRLLHRPVLIFDAIGLGVFCVEASAQAMQAGVGPWAATVVGMLTGVGGGMLRDVLANDIPVVFRRDTRLYLVPALLGAGLTSVVYHLGFFGLGDVLGLGNAVVLILIAAAVIALRLLSERYDWTMPGPRVFDPPPG